jgi:type II secretory pathway pseudopilin PulG
MARLPLTKQAGQTIIEVMIAIAIAAVILPALATAVVASREGRAQEAERLQATALARQAAEAVRSVREKGWSNISSLTAGSPYRPIIASNAWSLTAGAETIGNFTRQIVATDVERDSSGTIVDSGGTADPSTRKLTVTVSWTQPVTGSVVLEAYYQRYLSNAAWTQTTQAEFDGGTDTQTSVTATGGGQVELAPGTTPRLMQSDTTFNDALTKL